MNRIVNPNKPDNPIELDKVRFAMDSLVLYRQLLQDDVLRSLHMLIVHLSTNEDTDIFHSINLYSSLCNGLFNAGTGLKAYIIEKILHTGNPFALAAEMQGAACLEGSMKAAVINDLDKLQIPASLRPETLKHWIADSCTAGMWQKDVIMSLPSWIGEDMEAKTEAETKTDIETKVESAPDRGITDYSAGYIKELLLNSTCWHKAAEALACFHHRWGSGIFSKFRAVTWKHGDREGYFSGVDSPDPITFADMISYEEERAVVIENTLRFLEGYPANNILLYGDRGTGKSSTVKALVNEYYTRGLRIIEIPKKYLSDFPVIINKLSVRNLKFILFVDDLAFENNEEYYTALKAALEGGLEAKPRNVLIYATSNRKHLIKENFSDRAGLISGNADDEVHSADTMQEKLSLSDRFGMTVVFSSPDKKRYLEIVEGIIKNRGLDVDKDFLSREAMKWELRYNGRSPRTARQFADWLEGYMSKG